MPNRQIYVLEKRPHAGVVLRKVMHKLEGGPGLLRPDEVNEEDFDVFVSYISGKRLAGRRDPLTRRWIQESVDKDGEQFAKRHAEIVLRLVLQPLWRPITLNQNDYNDLTAARKKLDPDLNKKPGTKTVHRFFHTEKIAPEAEPISSYDESDAGPFWSAHFSPPGDDASFFFATDRIELVQSAIDAKCWEWAPDGETTATKHTATNTFPRKKLAPARPFVAYEVARVEGWYDPGAELATIQFEAQSQMPGQIDLTPMLKFYGLRYSANTEPNQDGRWIPAPFDPPPAEMESSNVDSVLPQGQFSGYEDLFSRIGLKREGVEHASWGTVTKLIRVTFSVPVSHIASIGGGVGSGSTGELVIPVQFFSRTEHAQAQSHPGYSAILFYGGEPAHKGDWLTWFRHHRVGRLKALEYRLDDDKYEFREGERPSKRDRQY